MEEFKDKVFKSIFSNTQQTAKNDPKNTKKKGGKK